MIASAAPYKSLTIIAARAGTTSLLMGRRVCRWIGNAAEDGRMATVFARLKVPSPDGSGAIDDHGVHAFLVPLRDEAGKIANGVEIRDCGYKVGRFWWWNQHLCALEGMAPPS